jgi:predicted esterase
MEATDDLIKLIDSEIEKVKDKDPRRIFIGGFSQGGAMSLATLMRWKGKKNLGGIISV